MKFATANILALWIVIGLCESIAPAYTDGTYSCPSVHRTLVVRTVQVGTSVTVPYLELTVTNPEVHTLKGFGTVLEEQDSESLRLEGNVQITFFKDHRDNGCTKSK